MHRIRDRMFNRVKRRSVSEWPRLFRGYESHESHLPLFTVSSSHQLPLLHRSFHSYNPLPSLSGISQSSPCPLASQRFLPAYPSENFLLHYPISSPALILLFAAIHPTFSSHSTLMLCFRNFSVRLEATLLPRVPAHVNNYFAGQKSSLAAILAFSTVPLLNTSNTAGLKTERFNALNPQ